MSAERNRQVVVAKIPQGALQVSDFEVREVPVPEPGAGQLLVRTLRLSMDPATRARISDAGHPGLLGVGDVMAGSALAEVVTSLEPGFAPGDIVECYTGWQDYSLQEPGAVATFDKLGTLEEHLSIYGVSGLTGYFGMREVGEPAPGKTVLVSAAGGAVGHIAGQVAKQLGARVVGIVGSEEKGRWLTETLGFDAAINRRGEKLSAQLKTICPDGIDIYFDNVGGEILEAVLPRMNEHGRVVCCGYASQYDVAAPVTATRGVPALLVGKRLRMEGFVVIDYYDMKQAARETLAGWLAAGQIKLSVDMLEGLERAPEAFVGLFGGDNRGKRLVRVAEPAVNAG